MGRTYSEYPYEDPQTTVSVRGSGLRLGNDEDTQKMAQQKKANLPDEGIHYRQPHAETLQRLKQKREARKAAAQSDAGGGRRAAAKKAPATRKTATAKKAAAKKTPMMKTAPAAKKSAGKTEAASAKAPARGTKVLSRVAAAAKTTVQRVAKKVPLPKALKKR